METETRVDLNDGHQSVTLWFGNDRVEMEVWTGKDESGMGKRFSEHFDLEESLEQLMLPKP